jgi:hypothetical protein
MRAEWKTADACYRIKKCNFMQGEKEKHDDGK